MNLLEVATEIGTAPGHDVHRGRRRAPPGVRRASRSSRAIPHWHDLLLFHEYFHGDNGAGIGASHQTGWTGTVALLFLLAGERVRSGSSRDARARRRRTRR